MDTVIALFKQQPNYNRDGGHVAPRAAEPPGPPLPPGNWGAQPAPVQGNWPAVHPQQQRPGYGQWPPAAGYTMQPTPQQVQLPPRSSVMCSRVACQSAECL